MNQPREEKSSSGTTKTGLKTLKTLPPKTIVAKPKWRNWLFFVLAIIILAMLVGAIWITVIKVSSFLSASPDSGTEETTGTEP